MPYDDVLVHEATPLRKASGNWVDGEPDVSDVPGTPFACCLFIPLAGESPSPRGRRQVTQPTLLLATFDDDDEPVSISTADELLVLAPEIPEPNGGPSPVRWEVVSGPQPFGPPGDDLVGEQVILKRVED